MRMHLQMPLHFTSRNQLQMLNLEIGLSPLAQERQKEDGESGFKKLNQSSLSMEQKKHLYTLDFLRGVAALSVCLFHFTGSVLPKLVHEAVKNLFSWDGWGLRFFLGSLVLLFRMYF